MADLLAEQIDVLYCFSWGESFAYRWGQGQRGVNKSLYWQVYYTSLRSSPTG
jgi:hypothetical protein